ncbi:MAG: hypothetical protein CBD97_01990 [Pelagibacteraceae bacterium TMED237]|nr:MAG: hypothetical protein CBD97_01990 [Pelagibacteraceae bacterium TMED237]|tara:strand:+ start:4384 stop:4728 length:345 start_codon:yes stop_codon:yes gene_type:complete
MATDGDDLPIDDLITKIEGKVDKFDTCNDDTSLKKSSMFSSITEHKYFKYIYIIIPIIIFVLFLILKPAFVKVSIETDDGEKKVVSYKKIIIFTGAISLIINILVYFGIKKFIK